MKLLKKEYKLIFSGLAFLILFTYPYLLNYVVDTLKWFTNNNYTTGQVNDVWNNIQYKTLFLVIIILSSIISYSCRNKSKYHKLFFSIVIAYLVDIYISRVFLKCSSINWYDLSILLVSLIIHFLNDFKAKVKLYAHKKN